MFSVSLLLAVTIWIITESIKIISNPPSQGDVNITIMWIFASINLVIDIICLVLFYRNKDTALIHHDNHNHITDDNINDNNDIEHNHNNSSSNNNNDDDTKSSSTLELEEVVKLRSSIAAIDATECNLLCNDNDNNINNNSVDIINNINKKSIKKNLNMLAAFYHVGADFLRTLAIYAGALAASLGIYIFKKYFNYIYNIS